MRYLCFDVETTGLPASWRAPVEDVNNWPRVVQLAWIVADENGVESKRRNLIIRPEGFVIPKESSDIHGISTDVAMERGSILKSVLYEFYHDMNHEDITSVAHNAAFDKPVLGAEFIRANYTNPIPARPSICTMLKTVKFCNIRTKRGPKWPKLQELHQKLFGHEFDDAHDALADVAATAKCFFELRKRGVITDD